MQLLWRVSDRAGYCVRMRNFPFTSSSERGFAGYTEKQSKLVFISMTHNRPTNDVSSRTHARSHSSEWKFPQHHLAPNRSLRLPYQWEQIPLADVQWVVGFGRHLAQQLRKARFAQGSFQLFLARCQLCRREAGRILVLIEVTVHIATDFCEANTKNKAHARHQIDKKRISSIGRAGH